MADVELQIEMKLWANDFGVFGSLDINGKTYWGNAKMDDVLGTLMGQVIDHTIELTEKRLREKSL